MGGGGEPLPPSLPQQLSIILGRIWGQFRLRLPGNPSTYVILLSDSAPWELRFTAGDFDEIVQLDDDAAFEDFIDAVDPNPSESFSEYLGTLGRISTNPGINLRVRTAVRYLATLLSILRRG